MNGKIFICLLLGIFLVSIVSAEVQTLKPVQQGDCIEIPQSHPNVTSINITKVRFPNGTEDHTVLPMSTTNNYNYNYTFCRTQALGGYEITTCGNGDGVMTCPAFDFQVTPSGQAGAGNMVFFIVVILAIYGIGLFGFFGRNIPISILGGMFMIGLGVYMVNQGLIIYRDWITNYLAYVTIATGTIFALTAVTEWIQDTI